MDWLDDDNVTELRRQELEVSKRICECHPHLRRGGRTKEQRSTPHASSNIGIPEKYGGWEIQDIQYHGYQFDEGRGSLFGNDEW